jgi:hypothetical protein
VSTSTKTSLDSPAMRLLSALVLSAALGSPATLFAQDARDTAVAQTLYDEAMKDYQNGKFTDACPKLERVVAKVPTGIGAKVDLAACYEAAGRLASAYGAFITAEGAARAQGDTTRASAAAEKAAALKPRLATLSVEVPAEVKAAPGFVLKRDGVVISDEEVGLALSIDKGEHVISVSATNRATWEKKLTINDGDKAKLQVELGAEQPAGTDPEPQKPVDPGNPGAGKQATESNFMSPLRIVGLTAGIVGVVGVGAGIGIGMHANGLYSQSNEPEGGCNADTNQCTKQEGVDLRADAVSFATISTGLTIASAVVGAAGIVLFAVAPSEEVSASEKTGVTDLQVAVAPGFVSLGGRF